MLIRFVVENFFSFGERKEFNMIPYQNLRTLNHHKYKEGNFEILKTASIYGANGSGKSNLIKSLEILQSLVLLEGLNYNLNQTTFKFNEDTESEDQILGIEFIQDDIPFYYAIVLNNGRVSEEELYKSGLGTKKDVLLFNRTTAKNNNSNILFPEEFENDAEGKVLKSVLLKEFVKPNEPILKLLSNRDHPFFDEIKIAYKWFRSTLQILTPNSKAGFLAHVIDVNREFKNYVNDFMCSLNLGITELNSEKKEIKEYFGDDNELEVNSLIKTVKSYPEKIIPMRNSMNEEIIIVNDDEKIWVKYLKVGHTGKKGVKKLFDLKEESDGTVRLLDFVPAFKSIISDKKVFVIDEIERSIHPLLIKELVEKFSLDEETSGQLIFTTHETNLLDQKIFRKDEIWFTEKNKEGATDLYSLNDFNVHKTIDIQKGYLNGRFGSIPFLGNLEDLNWHN